MDFHSDELCIHFLFPANVFGYLHLLFGGDDFTGKKNNNMSTDSSAPEACFCLFTHIKNVLHMGEAPENIGEKRKWLKDEPTALSLSLSHTPF